MSDNRLTFFSKTHTTCPICESAFFREEIYTGRGRLIAGRLTNELRRLYEPSKKYGEVNPLIYGVTVCPACYYAAFPQDFQNVPDRAKTSLSRTRSMREESIRHLFDTLDFSSPRRIEEGVAAYCFALMCYEHFTPDYIPTFKRGLASLRAAWLFGDLHHDRSGENFDYLARLFYHKARFFYSMTVEREQSGEERLGTTQNFGPDMDKNYGYDGLLYITGLLEYRYGHSEDPVRRQKTLENAKRTVSRIFGMGKASKDKPSAILDKSRELYTIITGEIRESTDDAT